VRRSRPVGPCSLLRADVERLDRLTKECWRALPQAEHLTPRERWAAQLDLAALRLSREHWKEIAGDPLLAVACYPWGLEKVRAHVQHAEELLARVVDVGIVS
jgi:hypothetical protein